MTRRDPHSYSYQQLEQLGRDFVRFRVREFCDITFQEFLADPIRYTATAVRLRRKHTTVARIVLEKFPPSNN